MLKMEQNMSCRLSGGPTLQCEYAGHCTALSEKEETRQEAKYCAQIAAVSAMGIGVRTRGVYRNDGF